MDTSEPKPTSRELVDFLLARGESPESISAATGAHWRTVYRWKNGDDALPPYYRALHEKAVAAGFGTT